MAARLEPETLGFLSEVAKHYATRPLKFVLSTFALIDDVVRSMLKTQVTLRNISLVLLNLIKRFLFVLFKLLHPMFTQLTFIFSL